MKHLSQLQICSLLNNAESKRNRLLLAICYEHGLRVSEAISLTPSRVQNGYLLTHPGKRGKLTIQRLSDPTLVLWREVSEGLDPDSPLFPFTRQWASELFHRAAEQAGISLAPRQGIHTLRHSIAHHLLDSGAPLPVVQRKLGHMSLSSTSHYLTADDSEVDAWTRKAIAA